jgi:hypothetical protein
VFFGVCVQVEALRRADHPSKEAYRLSLIKKTDETQPYAPKAGASSQVWEQRGRKNHLIINAMKSELMPTSINIVTLRPKAGIVKSE